MKAPIFALAIQLLALVVIELASASNFYQLTTKFKEALREDSAKLDDIANEFASAASAKLAGKSTEAARFTKAANLVRTILKVRQGTIKQAVGNTKSQREDIYVQNVLKAHRKADAQISDNIEALYALAADTDMLERVIELTRMLLDRKKLLANDLVEERHVHNARYEAIYVGYFGEPVELV